MSNNESPSDLVVVELGESIAFGGLAIRPEINDVKRGRKASVRAVPACVPRRIAEAHGLTVLAKAAPQMRPGRLGDPDELARIKAGLADQAEAQDETGAQAEEEASDKQQTTPADKQQRGGKKK